MSEAEYLTERLEDQICWYSDKASRCQTIHKRMKAAELILAALVPLILLIESPCSRWLAAFCGASIAVLSGIHGLGKYHENWIEYRAVAETLKHEKFLYLTRSGSYQNDAEAFPSLVEHVESIISHENINWSQLNQSSENRHT